MPSFALAAMAIVLALPVLWWAFFRPTTIVLPHALTQAVESEGFRRWLGEDSTWLLWGRDEEGRYYAITFGGLAARRLRRKADEFQEPDEREEAKNADAGSPGLDPGPA